PRVVCRHPVGSRYGFVSGRSVPRRRKADAGFGVVAPYGAGVSRKGLLGLYTHHVLGIPPAWTSDVPLPCFPGDEVFTHSPPRGKSPRRRFDPRARRDGATGREPGADLGGRPGSSGPFGKLGGNLAVAGVGRVLRPRQGRGVRAPARKRDHRGEGGVLSRTAPRTVDGGGPSPQGASRSAAPATALFGPRQADIRSPRVGMELGGSKGSARTGVGGGTMKISPEKLAAEA